MQAKRIVRRRFDMAADLVLVNGRIYTENKDMPWAECVGIKGEKICFVGSEKELNERGIAGKDTVIEDLRGRTVIPGMIDGHTHPATIAKSRWRLSLPETEDVNELLEFVRDFCNEHPADEVPFIFGVSYPTTMFGEDGPKKELLDQYVSDRPVKLQDFTDHACWYNSRALELMEVDADYPENGIAPFFVRDENNNPTGWVKEALLGGKEEEKMFEKIGWWPPQTVDGEMVRPFLEYLNDHGVICMLDGFTEGEDAMKAYYDLDNEGKLNMYYEGACELKSPDKLDECIETLKDWRKKYRTKHVDIHTVKFFIDGTNEMGNSASLEPLCSDPSGTDYGEINITEEELTRVLLRLNREKIDFHAHVVCDRGFRTACDAYEKALKVAEECGEDWNIYMQLAHCELVHPDDVKRPAELGIILNWSPHWAGGYFGDAAIEYLGRKRWDTMYDFTGFIKSGAVVTYSSDVIGPLESLRADPFYGMQTAATRVDIDFPLDPEVYPGSVRPSESAKLSVEDMLRGYTIDGAVPFRFEKLMGSIEEGKLANLVVLDRNIFGIPVDRLNGTCCEEVFFEGRKIRG